MKKVLGFAAGALLCLPLLAVTSMQAESDLTVGGFAVELARTLELSAPEAGFDGSTAALALEGAGVKLAGDLQERLREADVVEALNQLGLNLTTSNPDAPVSQGEVDDILRAYAKTPVAFSLEGGSKTKTKTKKTKGSPK